MKRPRRWVTLGLTILLLSLIAAGCATSPPPSRTTGTPRLRCVDDSARTGGGSGDRGSTGPMFFLFCVQSQ